MIAIKVLNKDFFFGAATFLLSSMGVWHCLSLNEGVRTFPLMVMIPSMFLGVAIAVRSQNKSGQQEGKIPFFTNVRRFFLMVVYMLLFFLGMDYLGYFTTSIIMLPLLSWLLGYRKPKVVMIGTICFLSLIYLLFIVIFSRPLPQEIWNTLLGS